MNDITNPRTKPEAHNTQYLEAMATYQFAADMLKQKVVLDAGCAFGYGTFYLAEYAKEVVGVDVSSKTIRWAQQHYRKENLGFLVNNISKLDFPDACFDAVCLFEAIQQLQDYKRAIKELKRVLKKDGMLLVSTRAIAGDIAGNESGQISSFPEDKLKNTLSEFGFNNIEIFGLNRPKDMYLLEERLQRVRKFDWLGVKKIIPRKIISKLVYFISQASGITPPQKFTSNDFFISKNALDASSGLLAVCRKGCDVRDNSQREKISCVLGTKNSEVDLVDCLDSVKWVDEIIIVDDFSTDRTLEIARRYTDKIYQQKFIGYTQQRYFGLEEASNRWILSLDADERVTPGLKDEIIEKLSGSTYCSGFNVRRRNIFLDKEVKRCGWDMGDNLRLFNKEKAAYDMTLRYLDENKVDGYIGSLKNELIHYTCRDLRGYFERLKVWSTLNAQDLLSKNVRVTIFSAPFLFLVKPGLVFTYKYFIKQGYRDGRVGFVISIFSAYNYFLSYVKVWQYQNMAKGKKAFFTSIGFGFIYMISDIPFF